MNVGGINIKFNLQEFFDRYNNLSRINSNKSQQIIVYDKENKAIIKSRNPNWFIEEGDSFYKKIGEIITKGQRTPHQKLLAIGNWLQNKLDYIPEEYAEINKTTYGTFLDHGGDCEDSFTAYKTLANALGLGDYVGGVFFDNHVATIIKGKLGPTTYNIEGETWTIVETATGEGQSVRPGVTNSKNPNFFILPDGKMVVAKGSNKIPLEIVPESQIDQRLLSNFNQNIEQIITFVNDERNMASEANLNRSHEFLNQINSLTESCTESYLAITESGKIAESVSSRYSNAFGKISNLAKQWSQIEEKHANNKRKLQVQNQPQEVTKSAKRFDTASKHFGQNVTVVGENMIKIFDGLVGKEADKQALIDGYNKMAEIIRNSGLNEDLDVMKHEYHDTLKHIPQMEPQAIKILDHHIEFMNKGIHQPLNNISEVLWKRYRVR